VLHALLEWLARLPPAALYAVACLSAAAENVFPPLPSDVVVAFAAFAAARDHGSAVAAFVAVLAGNVAGAMLMYALGARYGSAAVLKRFGGGDAQEAKLRDWYGRHGLAAIAVSRFLPGVRAVVPPVAGALGVGAIRAAVAMAVPSGLWYGGITVLAFRAGGDFEALLARVTSGQRVVGAVAVVLAAATAAVWWWRRRRARAAA